MPTCLSAPQQHSCSSCLPSCGHFTAQHTDLPSPPALPPPPCSLLQGARLTQDETSSEGAVSLTVLASYLQHMGGSISISLLMLSFLSLEAVRVGCNAWLSEWTGVWGGTGWVQCLAANMDQCGGGGYRSGAMLGCQHGLVCL